MINHTNSKSNSHIQEVRALAKARTLIEKTKVENAKKGNEGWRWCYDSNRAIPDACRDAVKLGYETVVQLFFKEGLNANDSAHERDNSGWSCPLIHFAAKVGNLSMVKLLVKNGAKIQDNRYFSDQHDNQDAMRAAIEGGHYPVVQHLLENGGSANRTCGVRLKEQTFLGRAAFLCQKPLVDLFVQHGARIKDALSKNNEWFRELLASYNGAISKYSDANRA